MSYNALYRRYRPSRFSEVIGQGHITEVLKNQIRTGRIAHAYLFSGSRGTGKTSSARILARAINCLDPRDGEPCLECEACRKTLSIDVIELDAASNSGVDEMRALIDKAELAPIELGTKIYIIDEAHMLSRSAENALLKTLEEPPAHVVFILATTEPQALPATILSRCQRFEFRRLSMADLMDTTRRILEDVGARIDDGALALIARAAEGGMRDCLSITDQCLSLCGESIAEDDVLAVLGSMNADFMFDFADAVIDGDGAELMRSVERVVSAGRDLGVFIRDISAHFRALLFAKVLGDCADVLDCTRDAMRRYVEQAERTGKARLTRSLTALMRLQQQLRFAPMPRVLLESELIALCHPEEETERLALEDRLDALERRLNDGDFAPSRREKTEKSGARAPEGREEPALEASVRPPQVVPESYEVPAASPEAEDAYKRFMAELMSADIMLGMQVQLSCAHWSDGECLYICFDRSKRSSYNYAAGPDARPRLLAAASASIAPLGIELVLKDGSVTVEKKPPTELFGVRITEE